MIGESETMQQVKTLAGKVAGSPGSTVLITGESGTGKDLLAKVIHYGSSRAARPFLNITCSALPDTLLESELFGHERGAFTDARQQKRGLFEQADQGTLFLDEIGEMAPALQAKLLAVPRREGVPAPRQHGGYQSGRAGDCRDQSRSRTGREGRQVSRRLYYRLNVLRIAMPPLRDRGATSSCSPSTT